MALDDRKKLILQASLRIIFKTPNLSVPAVSPKRQSWD